MAHYMGDVDLRDGRMFSAWIGRHVTVQGQSGNMMVQGRVGYVDGARPRDKLMLRG